MKEDPVLFHPAIRRGVPVLSALLAIALLAHRSLEPQILGRYTFKYLVLTLGIGLDAAILSWISLSRTRLNTLARSLRSLPVFSATCLAFSLVFLSDLFMDLDLLVPILPYAGALVLLVLSWRAPTGVRAHAEIWRSLAAAGLSTVLALTACEVFFRLVCLKPAVPRDEPGFQESVASHWPAPVPFEKPAGTRRFLGLCDSFGRAGDRRNYHYVLQGLLAPSSRIQIVNLSISEFQPADELELLRAWGPRFSPDLVIHGFFVGNDFFRTQGQLMTFGGLGVRKRLGTDSIRPRGSLFLEWFKRRWAVIRRARPAPLKGAPSPPHPDPGGRSPAIGPQGVTSPWEGTFSQEEFLGIERRLLDLCAKTHPPLVPLEEVLPVLDSIRREAEKMGAQYVMVLHPDQLQVEPGLRAKVSEAFGTDWQDYDLDVFQRFLGEYCRERGIPCLDLLPAFRAAGENGGLYLTRDTHYSPAGNELAGREILRFLQSASLDLGRLMRAVPTQ